MQRKFHGFWHFGRNILKFFLNITHGVRVGFRSYVLDHSNKISPHQRVLPYGGLKWPSGLKEILKMDGRSTPGTWYTNTVLVRIKKEHNIVIIFLPMSSNICYGCSKAPSQLDGSFEDPQHMF